jgi:tetraacyldisaccharide 4'-kinase
LSHGGRGKTPVVAHIARLLVDAGERPAILSRGYARAINDDGVVVVSDGMHLLADLDRAGDEPLMLAREVRGACVLVGEQRALCGALAERVLGATVHVLDDGFQHLQLARDVDLVLVNAADLRDRAVPFGRLREPVEALRFADAIVFDDGFTTKNTKGTKIHIEKPSSSSCASWFELRRAFGEPVPLDPDHPWSAPDRRVVAVAGIATPDRFADALRANGWTVADRIDFPDHHRFSPADVDRIAAVCRRTGAPMLTTTKDATRLLPLRPLPCPAAALPLSVSIEPAAEFQRWLFERIGLNSTHGIH